MPAFPEDVKFKVKKEGWNEYALSDGATLRTKLTLGKVIMSAGSTLKTAQSFNFQTQNHIVAYVPQKMKGTSIGRPLAPQELQDSVVEDLDFRQKKRCINEYELPKNIRIKLQLMLTRVSKTDKFAPDGSPIYTTQTQVVPQIKLPKGFGKKGQRKTGETPRHIV